MTTHKKILAIAAALAAATCAAPTAHADPVTYYSTGKDIAYDVKVEGQGKYTYAETVGSGEYANTNTAALDFNYTGEISDGVVFRGGRPQDTTGDDIPRGTATGTFAAAGGDGASSTCDVDAGYENAHGLMRVVDDADIDLMAPLDGTEDIWIRPFDHFDVLFHCPEEDVHPGVVFIAPDLQDDERDEHGELKVGHNLFDIKFNLPIDIVGMGQIQQLDPAKVVEGVRCPGYIADQTTTCRLEWTAKVTLTKLWEKPTPGTTTPPPAKTDDDDLLLPLGPPKPPAKNDDDDLLVPLVPQSKAKLSADASKATFSVSCSAGCSGTASVTAGSGGGAGTRAVAAKAAKPLATAKFTVAPGRSKTVTIRLGTRARKAIRRAGGARVAVRTTTRGRTQTRTLTLRLPKQARRR
jgi:hypothetical protein